MKDPVDEWECPDCHTRKSIVQGVTAGFEHQLLETHKLREQLAAAHTIALKLKEHYPSAKGVDELITICQPKQ